MGKKGQVTIFIILALIIIFGAVLFFVFRGNLNNGNLFGGEDSFKNSFDSCLADQSKWAVDYALNRGGIAPLENYSYFVDLGDNYVPYLIFKKERIIEDVKNSVEKSTSNILSKRIYICMNNSFSIGQERFNATYKELEKIDVRINKEKININIELPMSVSVGGDVRYYDKHSIVIDSKAWELINASEYLLEKQLETGDYIPLSFIVDYSNENNLRIDVIEIEEKSIIYSVTVIPYNSTEKMNGIMFGVNYA